MIPLRQRSEVLPLRFVEHLAAILIIAVAALLLAVLWLAARLLERNRTLRRLNKVWLEPLRSRQLRKARDSFDLDL